VNGESLLQEVPVDRVYVVKFIGAYASSTLAAISIHFKNISNGATLWHTSVNPLGVAWHGDLVTIAFEPGEIFGFFVDGVGEHADVFCGGYSLVKTLP